MDKPEIHQTEPLESPQPASAKKGLSFWLTMITLAISVFLAALELSAISTALPVIINDLHGAEFAWVGSAYPLASTAILPLSGGLAEIFGRRPAILLALILFCLGSALCGSAQNMPWLISARTIQGLGGGGILSISSIIVSDMVSLRERGTYNAIIGLSWSFSSAIGPLVAGGFANAGLWRWLFYINLPIGGLAMILILVLVKLPTPAGTIREKLSRIDWIGNALIITSTISMVIGLTWGGVVYEWQSPRVLIPLILGIAGIAVFFVYEARYCRNPMVPFVLLSNRSSLSGYVQTFVNSLGTLIVAYYMPVYYQACKDASVIKSGVFMLPLSLTLALVLILAGVSVTVLQRYRPQIWIAWCFFIVGAGIFSTSTSNSSVSFAVGVPVLMAIGSGILGATTYFPVLAPLPVTKNAHALAFFSFCRSFAGIWGISIGAAILQNQLGSRISQSTLELELLGGNLKLDMTYSVIPNIRFLDSPIKEEMQQAFSESLAVVWQVLVGLLGIGLIASMLMPGLPLQNKLDDKWTHQLNEKAQERSGADTNEINHS
ncbi:Mfs1.2 [Mycena floridula]|nr:Mfs1.2 [Mycena floridula]